MLTRTGYNIKEVKRATIIMLKVIDYVKILAININNYQEIYDKGEK